MLLLATAALGFSSLPAPYNEPKRWLIAATGQCTHQSYVQEAGGVVRRESARLGGDCGGGPAARRR